jgi:hypothetical protein
MATPDLQQVQPGDLITADFMNALLSSVSDLEVRVAELEAGSGTTATATGPVVTSTSPAQTVQVGGLLALFGLNFSPLSSTQVKIGEATVTQFAPGSDGQTLRLSVPQLSGLPRSVPITVTTPSGTSSPAVIMQVTPASVAQGGQAFVDDENASPPTPQPGQPAQYQFQVRSETLQPVTYAFTAVAALVNPASPPTVWPVTLNSSQQQIAEGTPFVAVVTVMVPAGATTGESASLTLTARSLDGALTATSSPVPVTVGQAAPVSNAGIQLAVSDPQPVADVNGQLNPVSLTHDPSTNQPIILVPPATSGWIQVGVTFADQNATPPINYTFSSSMEGSPTTWVAGTDVRPAKLQRPSLGGITTVNYQIENTAATGDNADHDAFIEATAQKLKADGSVDYTSFVRIQIRNQS